MKIGRGIEWEVFYGSRRSLQKWVPKNDISRNFVDDSDQEWGTMVRPVSANNRGSVLMARGRFSSERGSRYQNWTFSEVLCISARYCSLNMVYSCRENHGDPSSISISNTWALVCANWIYREEHIENTWVETSNRVKLMTNYIIWKTFYGRLFIY